jgi:AcrR family transcriptional regulator
MAICLTSQGLTSQDPGVKRGRTVRRPTNLEQRLAAPGDERPVTPADALHAARRHFLRGERLDMNELARELGIGRATLYRWVGGRDQLLGEVIWSLAAPGLAQARAEAKGRGAAWVLAIYRRYGDMIVEFEPLRRFVKSEPECALRVMTSKASPQQRRVVDAFHEILAEAQEHKGLQLRLDPETLAFALVRIGESFLWTDLITGEAPDLTKAHELARMLLT